MLGAGGGWTKVLLGADALPLAGALAACIVTFLPSFLLILLGGRFIEMGGLGNFAGLLRAVN